MDLSFPKKYMPKEFVALSCPNRRRLRTLSSFILPILSLISTTQAMHEPISSKKTPRRYLALGDSYTIGESVDESERWPSLLVAKLRATGIQIEDPLIIAKTGWTTDELNAAIDKESPKAPFDIVSLLIGVNNQYRARSLEEYRKKFSALLERAITFADNDPKRVIVVSIPDWGATPFAEGRDKKRIAREIDEYNNINRELTEARGSLYIDITPRSRDAANDSTLLASDGLHPSRILYEEWAELVLPIAQDMLCE